MKEQLKKVWLILSGKFKEYAVIALKELNAEAVTEHEHYRFKDIDVLALFLTQFQCLYTYRKIRKSEEGYELYLFLSSGTFVDRIGKVLYVRFINKFRTQCNLILRDLFKALEVDPVKEIHPQFYQIGKHRFIHKLTGPKDYYLIVNNELSEVFNPKQSPFVLFLAELVESRAKETLYKEGLKEKFSNKDGNENHTVEIEDSE